MTDDEAMRARVSDCARLLGEALSANARLSVYLTSQTLDWETVHEMGEAVFTACEALADAMMPADMPGGRFVLLREGPVYIPDAPTERDGGN